MKGLGSAEKPSCRSISRRSNSWRNKGRPHDYCPEEIRGTNIGRLEAATPPRMGQSGSTAASEGAARCVRVCFRPGRELPWFLILA